MDPLQQGTPMQRRRSDPQQAVERRKSDGSQSSPGPSAALAHTELLHMLDDRVRLISNLEERVKDVEGKLVENDAQHGRMFDDQLAIQERTEDFEEKAESLAAQAEDFQNRLELLSEYVKELSKQEKQLEAQATHIEVKERQLEKQVTHTSSVHANLDQTELLHMLDDRVRQISLLEEQVKEHRQKLDENDAQHNQFYDDQISLQERAEAMEQESSLLAARAEELDKRLAALEAARNGAAGSPKGKKVNFAAEDECMEPGVEGASPEPSLAARLEAKDTAATEALASRLELLEKRVLEAASAPAAPGEELERRLEALEKQTRDMFIKEVSTLNVQSSGLERRLEAVERRAPQAQEEGLGASQTKACEEMLAAMEHRVQESLEDVRKEAAKIRADLAGDQAERPPAGAEPATPGTLDAALAEVTALAGRMSSLEALVEETGESSRRFFDDHYSKVVKLQSRLDSANQSQSERLEQMECSHDEWRGVFQQYGERMAAIEQRAAEEPRSHSPGVASEELVKGIQKKLVDEQDAKALALEKRLSAQVEDHEGARQATEKRLRTLEEQAQEALERVGRSLTATRGDILEQRLEALERRGELSGSQAALEQRLESLERRAELTASQAALDVRLEGLEKRVEAAGAQAAQSQATEKRLRTLEEQAQEALERVGRSLTATRGDILEQRLEALERRGELSGSQAALEQRLESLERRAELAASQAALDVRLEGLEKRVEAAGAQAAQSQVLEARLEAVELRSQEVAVQKQASLTARSDMHERVEGLERRAREAALVPASPGSPALEARLGALEVTVEARVEALELRVKDSAEVPASWAGPLATKSDVLERRLDSVERRLQEAFEHDLGARAARGEALEKRLEAFELRMQESSEQEGKTLERRLESFDQRVRETQEQERAAVVDQGKALEKRVLALERRSQETAEPERTEERFEAMERRVRDVARHEVGGEISTLGARVAGLERRVEEGSAEHRQLRVEHGAEASRLHGCLDAALQSRGEAIEKRLEAFELRVQQSLEQEGKALERRHESLDRRMREAQEQEAANLADQGKALDKRVLALERRFQETAEHERVEERFEAIERRVREAARQEVTSAAAQGRLAEERLEALERRTQEVRQEAWQESGKAREELQGALQNNAREQERRTAAVDSRLQALEIQLTQVGVGRAAAAADAGEMSRLQCRLDAALQSHGERLDHFGETHDKWRIVLQQYSERLCSVEEYGRRLSSVELAVSGRDLQEAAGPLGDRMAALERQVEEGHARHGRLIDEQTSLTSQTMDLVRQEQNVRETQVTSLEQRLGAVTGFREECRLEVSSLRGSVAQLEASCRDIACSLSLSVQRLEDISGGLQQLEGHVVCKLGAATQALATSPGGLQEPPSLSQLHCEVEDLRQRVGCFDEDLARSMHEGISRAEERFAAIFCHNGRQGSGQPPSKDRAEPASLHEVAARVDLAAADIRRQVDARVASAEAYVKATETGLDREFKKHVRDLSERVGRLEATAADWGGPSALCARGPTQQQELLEVGRHVAELGSRLGSLEARARLQSPPMPDSRLVKLESEVKLTTALASSLL